MKTFICLFEPLNLPNNSGIGSTNGVSLRMALFFFDQPISGGVSAQGNIFENSNDFCSFAL